MHADALYGEDGAAPLGEDDEDEDYDEDMEVCMACT